MTQPAWKVRCLLLAECVDAWRVMPRLLMLAYIGFVYHITTFLLNWYVNLPADERSMEASGFAFGVFTAITGLGTVFLNAYLKSGRKWNGSSSE